MSVNAVQSAPDAPAVAASGWRSWTKSLRPRQWVKNFFILTPLLFSGQVRDPAATLAAFAAFAAFCALASGIYLLNDIIDRESDRAHPVKRNRPIASGAISPAAAAVVAAALLLTGMAWSALIAPRVGWLALFYVALNAAYSTALKHVVILDVFTIGAFFITRLLVGAAAIGVTPSIWLLLCGGLLALYLAFAKRRHELILLRDGSGAHRAVLSQYTATVLDQISVLLLAVTVVSYVMYTLESGTAKQIGSDALAYSTVFVLYGVIRYLFLVHQHDGGDPSESLLTDRALLGAVVLWVLYCGIIIYRPF